MELRSTELPIVKIDKRFAEVLESCAGCSAGQPEIANYARRLASCIREHEPLAGVSLELLSYLSGLRRAFPNYSEDLSFSSTVLGQLSTRSICRTQSESKGLVKLRRVADRLQAVIDSQGVATDGPRPVERGNSIAAVQSPTRNKSVNERVIELWATQRDMIGATSGRVAKELGLEGRDPASSVRKTNAWKVIRPKLLEAERSNAGVVGITRAQIVDELAMGMRS